MMNYFHKLRHAFPRPRNKQIIIFLFFLALSTAFWFFQALNEVYEEDFDVPVDVKTLPAGKVITGDVPKTVRVTLKDRGVVLLNYKYGDKIRHVTIDPNNFSGREGRLRLLAADVVKQIRSSLAQGTQVVGVKPDTIDIYYNQGRSRRLPILLSGNATAAAGFTITDQHLRPDSVTVYGATDVLDTLTALYLPIGHLRDLTATATHTLTLPAAPGVKISPAEVKMTIAIDRLIEKKVTVPITGDNFPEGVRLRTFPSQVEIICQVCIALYRNIRADQFCVSVDYQQLPTDGSTHCRLRVTQSPAAVSHVRLATEEVEYVLEKQR
jgi:hypothetical protein